MLEGNRVSIQGWSILGMRCVFCFLETLYIRLKLVDVLLKVVCMGILNRWWIWFSFDSSVFGLTFWRISCRKPISWVSESVSAKWCFWFAKVTAWSYVWVYRIRSGPKIFCCTGNSTWHVSVLRPFMYVSNEDPCRNSCSLTCML